MTAVDRLETEIEEARPKAPTANWKVADARDLPFEDGSFDNATAFFSLMYMTKLGVKQEVLAEVFRVLAPGGEFWIWDASISTKKKMFIVFLKIQLPNSRIIKTGYGARVHDKQTAEQVLQLLQKVGFETEEAFSNKAWFFVKAKKPASL